MKSVELGNTGITVSRLCLGTDILGRPKQRAPSPAKYATVLRRALDLGVNFWDTSDDYGTHPHIRFALQGIGRAQVVIATKTWARDGEAARRSLESSLSELDMDYVDVFLIHYASPNDLNSVLRTIQALQKAKADGLVRALGLTTHFVAVASRVAEEPDVEVVYVTFNSIAYDIEDGSVEDMGEAAGRCFAAGKGVCTMKALAKGNLVYNLVPELQFSFNFPYAHAALVGIRSVDELEADVMIAEGKSVPKPALQRLIAPRL